MTRRPGRLLAVTLAVAALVSCAPDLPDLSETPGEVVPGATIDAGVVAAADAAGLSDCPTGSGEASEAPSVDLVCLSTGETASLADLAGTPVLVNVWAHWCTECREELPLLARAAREYEGRVQIVGVLFADEDPAAAIDLARASGVTYPHLADPDSRLTVPLGLRGLPQNVYLDADGRVVGTAFGSFRTYDDVVQAIDEQLGVRP
ncbi:antioxidant, AhpC/TSA family [Aeromicrobium marinum DSM 15272]|uniref:Antioxidant, AhpC/TSA family n=1 Tax=Aeromicrobium marinum DSM 15272 TaxID=585531 RepID=E2SC71_9ACTN|nr:TlpA disulfide reductase family protein [Aeromicrobium marinum]EFQ83357.1 antioxidant, AhpC/TSA family [Aeromicrobium marinum DSM 15272]